MSNAVVAQLIANNVNLTTELSNVRVQMAHIRAEITKWRLRSRQLSAELRDLKSANTQVTEVAVSGNKKVSKSVIDLLWKVRQLVIIYQTMKRFTWAAKLAADKQQMINLTEQWAGSLERAEAIFKRISQYELKTGISKNHIAEVGSELAVFTGSVNKAENMLQRLVQLASGTGHSIKNLSEVYISIAHRGSTTASELDTFVRAGIPIMEELAKVTGMTKEELRELDAIKFADVHMALVSLTAEGGRFSKVLKVKGLANDWKVFQLEMKSLVTDVFTKLIPLAEAFTQKLTDWVRELKKVKQVSVDLLDFYRERKDMDLPGAKKPGGDIRKYSSRDLTDQEVEHAKAIASQILRLKLGQAANQKMLDAGTTTSVFEVMGTKDRKEAAKRFDQEITNAKRQLGEILGLTQGRSDLVHRVEKVTNGMANAMREHNEAYQKFLDKVREETEAALRIARGGTGIGETAMPEPDPMAIKKAYDEIAKRHGLALMDEPESKTALRPPMIPDSALRDPKGEDFNSPINVLGIKAKMLLRDLGSGIADGAAGIADIPEKMVPGVAALKEAMDRMKEDAKAQIAAAMIAEEDRKKEEDKANKGFKASVEGLSALHDRLQAGAASKDPVVNELRRQQEALDRANVLVERLIKNTDPTLLPKALREAVENLNLVPRFR